jgi:hypothetical protein
VNPGSEPERDDTGLPPVDIEIPDDARELDRDVQSYYREQRALRRHRRSVRLRGALGKEGIVLPLLACCLILALITGTLLTVFSATSDVGRPGKPGGNHPGTGSSGSPARSTSTSPNTNASAPPQAHGEGSASADASSPATSPGTSSRPASSPSAKAPSAGTTRANSAAATRAGAQSAADSNSTPAALPGEPSLVPTAGPLPRGVLQAGAGSVQLADLSRAVLVLLPAGCNCGITVARVAGVAGDAGAKAYLIGTGTTAGAARALAARLNSRPGMHVTVAIDSDNSLRSHYKHSGLTAIVVAPDKHVFVAITLKPADNLTSLARTLAH